MSVAIRTMQSPRIPLFKVFMADAVKDAVVRVLYSGFVGEGEEVVAFERDLADASRPIACSRSAGTSALHRLSHGNRRAMTPKSSRPR